MWQIGLVETTKEIQVRLILCFSVLLITVHAAAQTDNRSVMATKVAPASVVGAQFVAQTTGSFAAAAPSATMRPTYRFAESFTFGIHDHPVDAFTEVIGWRLNERWYFGHQDGEDSGITLVWQAERDQMSVSKDGIRFTRRF